MMHLQATAAPGLLLAILLALPAAHAANWPDCANILADLRLPQFAGRTADARQAILVRARTCMARGFNPSYNNPQLQQAVEAIGWHILGEEVIRKDWFSWPSLRTALRNRTSQPAVQPVETLQVIQPASPEAAAEWNPTPFESMHSNLVSAAAVTDLAGQMRAMREQGHSRLYPGFPSGSILVKGIWRRIPAGGRIRLGIWPGINAVTRPQNPFPMREWPDCVFVVKGAAPGSGLSSCGVPNGTSPGRMGNTISSSTFIEVDVNDQNRSRFLTQGGQKAQTGDTMILVGLHVMDKALPDWLWSTFWWTPTAEQALLQSPAKPLAMRDDPVWKRFAGKTSISFNNPATATASPNRMFVDYNTHFNPYLEASELKWGTVSSCLSCHSRATCPSALLQGGESSVAGISFFDLRPRKSGTGVDLVFVGGKELDGVTENGIRSDYSWTLAALTCNP